MQKRVPLSSFGLLSNRRPCTKTGGHFQAGSEDRYQEEALVSISSNQQLSQKTYLSG